MMVGSLIYGCWIVRLGAVVGVGQISNVLLKAERHYRTWKD